MNRRGFLASILAAGAAPAIIKADSLMRLWAPTAPPDWSFTSSEMILTLEDYSSRLLIPAVDLIEALTYNQALAAAIDWSKKTISAGMPKIYHHPVHNLQLPKK